MSTAGPDPEPAINLSATPEQVGLHRVKSTTDGSQLGLDLPKPFTMADHLRA